MSTDPPWPFEPPSITCPHCGWVSYNPHDIEQGYCGHCHRFWGDERESK